MTLFLFPVAVPCVRLADVAAALHTDRCNSLKLRNILPENNLLYRNVVE